MLYTGSLQKKIVGLSATYYNKALELCREDRISEAVGELRKSLKKSYGSLLLQIRQSS